MTDPLEILEALVPAFDEIDGGNPRYQEEFMEAANKILQQHDIDGRYRFKGEGVWNGVEFIPVEDFEWVKPPPPPLIEDAKKAHGIDPVLMFAYTFYGVGDNRISCRILSCLPNQEVDPNLPPENPST